MLGLGVGDVTAVLKMDTSQFDRALMTSAQRLSDFSRRLGQMGSYLTLRVTLPFAYFGAKVTKQFASFDDAITRSAAVTRNMSDVMRKEMEKTALTISKRSILTATELAQGYFALGQAGYTAAQSIKALPVVQDFAIASTVSLDTSIRYLVRTVNGLNMASEDAVENMKAMKTVGDSFTYAAITTTAEVRDFAVAMTHAAAPALRLVNKSMEEGTAALMAFASAGIIAEEAGTLLWTTIRDLQRANIIARKEWDRLKISVYDMSGKMLNLADIFGQLEKKFMNLSDENKKLGLMMLGFQDRSLRGIQALMGFSEQMREWQNNLEDGGDLMKEVADKYMKSFASQLKMLTNHLIVLKIELGKVLSPYIAKFGEWIKKITNWFISLTEAQKDAIVQWGLFFTVLGPIVLLVSKLGIALSFLFVTMASHPILLVATALTILAAALSDFSVSADVAERKASSMRKVLVDLKTAVKELRKVQDELNEAIMKGDELGEKQATFKQIKQLQDVLKDLLLTQSRSGDFRTVRLKTIQGLVPGKIDIKKYWEEALSGITPESIEKYTGSVLRGGPYIEAFKKLQQSMLFEPVMDVPDKWWKSLFGGLKQKWMDFSDLGVDSYERLTVSSEEFSKRARQNLMEAYTLTGIPISDAIDLIVKEIERLGGSTEEVKRTIEELGDVTSTQVNLLADLQFRRAPFLTEMKDALEEEKAAQKYILLGYEHIAEILEYQAMLQTEANVRYYHITDEVEKQAKVQKYIKEGMKEYLSIVRELENLEKYGAGAVVKRRETLQDNVDILKAEIEASAYLNQSYSHATKIVEQRKLLLEEAAYLYKDVTNEMEKQALIQAYVNENMEAYLELVKEVERIQSKKSLERWIEEAGQLGEAFEEDLVHSLESFSDALTDLMVKGELDWKQFTASILTEFLKTIVKMQVAAAFSSVLMPAGTGLLDIFRNTGSKTKLSTSGILGTGPGRLSTASGDMYAALGAVFSRGQLIPMQTGGIINHPALVPMAQRRTALIGEAGPEAVMPLQRDASGRLGVRSEQQAPIVNTKIVNVYDREEMLASLNTARGERLILNILRRNGAI